MAAGCKKQLKNEDGETPSALATHNQAAEIQVLLQIDRTNNMNQTTGQDKVSDSERQRPIRTQKVKLGRVDISLNCEYLFDYSENGTKWLDHRLDTNLAAILLCKWNSDSSKAGPRWFRTSD
jgi:hypothetical protein